MSGFKKNANLNTQGEGAKKLAPGIYKGAIVAISKGEKQIYNSEDKEGCLNVTFKDNNTGKEHFEQIGFPKETAKTTLEDASVYAYENMLHLAHPFLTEEEMIDFETKAESFKDFEELVDKYSELMSNKIIGVGVELIIEGSVINGKTPTSKIPNFNSRGLNLDKPIKPSAYITKIGSSVTLKETGNQIKGKAAYFEALGGQSASSDTGTGTPKKTAESLFE